MKGKRWITWGISASLFLMQFLLQLGIGVMVKQLGEAFGISEFGIGVLASGYYILYVLMQMPAGIVVDHLGARACLIFSSTFMGLGCLVFSQTTHLWLAFVARLMMGFASAFIFISTLALVRHWFPPKKFGLLAGLTETLGLMGVFLGTFPFAALLHLITWRHLYLGLGLIVFVQQLAVILFVQNYPEKHKFQRKHLKWSQFVKNSKEILSTGTLWINGIYAGILFTVLAVFITLWALPFFRTASGYSDIQATVISSIGVVAIALGIPLMGVLYHELKKVRAFMIFCSLYSALLMCWFLYLTPYSFWLNCVLMFLLGLGMSVYVFNFAIVNRFAPNHLVASSLGFTNALCVLITPIIQPITGWVLEYYETVEKIPPTTSNLLFEYRISLAIIPIILAFSGFLAWKIPSD